MSKKEKIAIVPGSFDPITFGHIYVIKEALKKFDTVYVAVMINKEKNYMFSLDERKRIVEAALSTDSVKVISSEGWLWELAVELNATGIVKGYRNDSDLAYELEMASFNEKHAPNAKTFLIKTDSVFEKISSDNGDITAESLDSAYLAAIEVVGIPMDTSVEFTVKPFVSHGGVKIYGESCTVKFSQGAIVE